MPILKFLNIDFQFNRRLQLCNYELLTFNDRNIPQTSLRVVFFKIFTRNTFRLKNRFPFWVLKFTPLHDFSMGIFKCVQLLNIFSQTVFCNIHTHSEILFTHTGVTFLVLSKRSLILFKFQVFWSRINFIFKIFDYFLSKFFTVSTIHSTKTMSRD